MKITWYFIPNLVSKLAYAQAGTTELIVDEKEELKTSMDSNENNKTGIIDWAKSNKKFLEIIDQHAINDLSNQEIIYQIWGEPDNSINSNILSDRSGEEDK